VENTTKPKPETIDDAFYKLYVETTPHITLFTMTFGVFSYSTHSFVNLDIDKRSIFFEDVITGATLGFFVGMTYPISFPLIAINNIMRNS